MKSVSEQNLFFRFSFWLLLLGIFMNPISIALSNLVLVGAVLSLFLPYWTWRVNFFGSHTFMWIFALMLLLATMVLFTGEKPPVAQFHTWGTKLYMLIMLLAILPWFLNKTNREMALSAYIYGIVAVNILLWFYSVFIGLMNDSTDIFFPLSEHAVRLYHWTSYLPLSIMSAFAVFLLLHRLIDFKESRFWIFLQILVVLYVQLFLISKRTGVVTLGVLAVVFCWQRIPGKYFYGLVLFLAILIASVLSADFQVSHKFSQSAKDVHTYLAIQKGEVSEDKAQQFYGQSSVGQRLYITELGARIIKEKPWFGHGSNTIAENFNHLNDPIFNSFHRTRMQDPDNIYLQVGIEYGLVGLGLYLLLLIALFVEAKYLPTHERFYARGLVIAYFVAGFSASVTWKHATMMLMYCLVAVFYAGSSKVKSMMA